MLNKYSGDGRGGRGRGVTLNKFSQASATLLGVLKGPQSWLGPQEEMSSVSTPPTPIRKLKPEITPFVSHFGCQDRKKTNLSRQVIKVTPVTEKCFPKSLRGRTPQSQGGSFEKNPLRSVTSLCKPRGQAHTSSTPFPRQNPGEGLPDPIRSLRMPGQAWAGLTE